MTIRERMVKKLYDMGVLESRAHKVIDYFLKSKWSQGVSDRIDEDETAYPQQLIDLIWFGVKAAEAEYRARQMFIQTLSSQ